MRKYYDHEAGYRSIALRGGVGWDDCPSLPPQTPPGSYDALDAFLASPLAPLPGDAIDLGCGGGQASLRLAACGHRVTGVDYAPTAIELARRNAAGTAIRFLEGDVTALTELESASFDLAVDNHVLHCLIGDDRGRFLREVARVLRPGGLLFSDTMSREGDFDAERLGIDPVTFVLRGNRYWTSARELDDDLARAGFEIIASTANANPDLGFGDGLMRVARL